MRPVIAPFFISHQGCPHECVFCDQRLITGESGIIPEPAKINAVVSEWRSTACSGAVEVAFYGGSFTMLSRELQLRLLLPLQPLLASGAVSSIRISTRPDAIDGPTVSFLKGHGVSLVELGVQSMDDHVLRRANRGHSVDDIRTSFEILKAAGVMVGAQMMPGLPGENSEEALHSFREVIALKPDCIRIYPAVVLQGTVLARMFESGEFHPLSLDDTISCCKVMLHEAELAGISVIRVGLQATDALSTGSKVIAGPYHPALRQLVQGERWYDLLLMMTQKSLSGESLSLYVHPTEVSDVVGQGRRNILRCEGSSGVKIDAVCSDTAVRKGSIFIKTIRGVIHGNLLCDLVYT